MKDQVKKHSRKSQNPNGASPERWLRVSRTLLCIFLAVMVCASCALCEVLRLQAKAREKVDLSDAEAEKIRIYIDQGHNPSPHHNIGAEGNGLHEQDLTYEIGCLLAALLEQDGRFEVCLSRPEPSTVLGTDIASSLSARVAGAAEFEADYFISLHINAYTDEKANGIEVLVFEENSESYDFGRSLLKGMLDATGLGNRGMKIEPELYVLKNATTPAVLLEMGFISNPEDAAFLSAHAALFAEGIYDGILDYFETSYTADLYLLLCLIGVSAGAVLVLKITDGIIKKNDSRKQANTKRQG